MMSNKKMSRKDKDKIIDLLMEAEEDTRSYEFLLEREDEYRYLLELISLFMRKKITKKTLGVKLSEYIIECARYYYSNKLEQMMKEEIEEEIQIVINTEDDDDA